MNPRLKAFVKSSVLPVFARREMQPAFEWLHRVALVGMNCGPVGELATSGEMPLARRLMARAPADAVVFDVGANIGEFSIACANALPLTAHVYAFEPSPTIHATLAHNIESASLQRRVTAVRLGLSDAVRDAELIFTEGYEGNSSLRARLVDHLVADAERQQVQLTTIDAFCASAQISRVYFLKVDIEGEELACLRGAEALLREKGVDYVQFEFGGCNIQSRVFFRDFWTLLSPSYSLFRVVQNGIRAVSQYHELQEIFTTTNFLGVRKGLAAPWE